MASADIDFSFLYEDPLFKAMESGECLWGDLCMDTAAEAPATPEPVIREELPEDWDLDFPVLRLRKDIWTEFPVTVTPLGAGPDGAERHAISWHRANFEEWRITRVDSFEEGMEYAAITEYRLLKCLHASKFWTVEDATAADQICIIRMNYLPREDASTIVPAKAEPTVVDDSDDLWVPVTKASLAPAPPKAPARPSVPIFTRLNDIKEHFPVVWHKDEGARTRTAVYVMEIFGKKVLEMSRASGKSVDAVRADVESRLMTALKASPAWRVLRSEGREFCRLEMA